MTDIEAMQLLIKCRELGISQLEIAALVEKSKVEKPIEQDLDAQLKAVFSSEEYSDEEILYYATPYFDEIQRRKKTQAEKVDGET